MRRGRGTALAAVGVVLVGCASPQASRPGDPPRADLVALPVCADSLPFTGDTAGAGYHPPRPLRLVLPVVNRGRMRGKVVTVRHLVTAIGQVDSVVVEGVTEPRDLAPFERAAQNVRYVPAQLNGCWRRGWYAMEMTFP